MKLNELISDFQIFTTNEESALLEKMHHYHNLNEFDEHEQVVIDNLIKKSLISKVRYKNQVMVMKDDL